MPKVGYHKKVGKGLEQSSAILFKCLQNRKLDTDKSNLLLSGKIEIILNIDGKKMRNEKTSKSFG